MADHDERIPGEQAPAEQPPEPLTEEDWLVVERYLWRVMPPVLAFLAGVGVTAWCLGIETALEGCANACAQSGGVVEHHDGGICRCRPSCIRGEDLPLQPRIIEEILDAHRERAR